MRLFALALLMLSTCAMAQPQENYDAALIPKELLAHAGAVVRNEEETTDVKDPGNVIYHTKRVVTILNKNGDNMAELDLEHDKINTIKFIKGAIYDEFGKQQGKFSESDFEDSGAWDGFSLFTDTKVKHYRPSVNQYPYTIAYEYETRSKQSLGLRSWKPNPYFDVSVQKSLFTLISKPDFTIHYKENNVPNKVIISTNAQGFNVYAWRAENLKAVKYEPFSPYSGNYLSSVNIAPEKFSFYGLTGSFTSWKDLGKWEYDKLVADRQELPAETIEHIKEITKDITDPKLKAKKVYEYMQAKTHYISVQVGVGGNQPFLASDVDKQNYGDCKALVNYTQALLKAININSYYCVVHAGGDYKVSMPADFPSLQGNHIILCIPFKNDTTWADCTSQTIPFGYLGPFTDDRTVLACTPDGGILLHTPKYTFGSNLEKRKANFVIDDNGTLTGNMSTVLKGSDYEDREQMINESQVERYKTLQHIYPINNMTIEKFDLKQDKNLDPATTEDIKLSASEYASVSDGRIYFLINPANRHTYIPEQVINRKNKVYINRGYTDEDEVTYTLPVGYKTDKKPLDFSVTKPFGKYSATMQIDGNKIIYKRNLQLIDGTYDKEMYQQLIDFYQDVYDADSYGVTLVKGT